MGDVAGERGAGGPLLRAGDEQGGLVDRHAEDEEFCHPEVEWTSREDGLTYRGREGAQEALERWLDSFADYRYEVQRIIDCGGDDVLVVGLEVGTGAMSGAKVRSINHELLTVRDGMIVRFREFYDESEALEAVGLRE